jgi:hypothetical protein
MADNNNQCDVVRPAVQLVAVANMSVPEYYTEEISAMEKLLYSRFGITYVHVRHNERDYYIYTPQLTVVVDRLKLYV